MNNTNKTIKISWKVISWVIVDDRKAQACQHNYAHPDKNIDEKKA